MQGSAIGPILFTVMISDLKASGDLNDVIKFADDATLLVPDDTDVCLEDEMNHICTWASVNKLQINLSKTKEIVFHRPNPRNAIDPPLLDRVERVTCAKLLGINLNHDLRFTTHVSDILTVCSQRLFLLRTLKNRDVSQRCLNIIFSALILAKITYALPAWAGFLLQSDIAKIDSFLAKCHRFGYTPKKFNLRLLIDDADQKLFSKTKLSNHCLHSLLPLPKKIDHMLRARGHSFRLPNAQCDLYKKSFLIRCLYKFV